jgi:hypothetical protein
MRVAYSCLLGLILSACLTASSAEATPNIRLTSDSANSTRPRLALDPVGNAVVVWQEDRFGNYEICWQKFNQLGTPLTGVVRVTNTPDPSVRPDIACDANGTSHVVWQEREDNGVGTVMLCRLDSSGSKTLSDTSVKGSSGDPRISCPSAGVCDIAWGTLSGFDQYVNYRRYDATGTVVCDKSTIGLGGPGSGESKTAVIANEANGEARIFWRDLKPDFQFAIGACFLNNSCGVTLQQPLYSNNAAINPATEVGGPLFTIFEMGGDIYNYTSMPCKITQGSGTSSHPALGADPASAYAAWQDTRDGNSEIYFCKFYGCANNSGDTRLTNDPASSMAPDIAVEKSGSGNWVVVWQDSRDGNAEIYLTSKALIGSCLTSGTVDVAKISQGATVTSYSSIFSGGQPNDVIGGTASNYGGGGETGTFIFGAGDPDQGFVIQLGTGYPLHEITSTQSGGTSDREVWDLLEILTRNGSDPWISWGYLPGDYNIPGTVTFTQNPPVMATEIKCRYGRYSPDWGGGSRVYEISALATVDHPPSVTVVGTASGTEGVPLEVVVSASDPDCEPIASLTASGTAMVAGGSFTPGSGNTTGIFTWTPSYGQAGTYSVTFSASNTLSGTSTTSIAVAAGPHIRGTVSAQYWPQDPYEPARTGPWRWGRVRLMRGGTAVYDTFTDDAGSFDIPQASMPGDYLQYSLQGPYAIVCRWNGPDSTEVKGAIEAVGDPGVPLSYTWPVSEEVNTFYHANRALRDFWHSRLECEFAASPLVPAPRYLTSQIAFRINSPKVSGDAFSDLSYAEFGPGKGKYSDAVYHEIAHIMIRTSACFRASPDGWHAGCRMLDGKCNLDDPVAGAIAEGLADYFAATLNNDPNIVDHSVALFWPLRRTNTDKKAPGLQCEFNYDSHDGAPIVSGALWTLRGLIDGTVEDARRTDTLVRDGIAGIYAADPNFTTYATFESLRSALCDAQGGTYQTNVDEAFAGYNIPRASGAEFCPSKGIARAERVGAAVRISWDPVPGVNEWWVWARNNNKTGAEPSTAIATTRFQVIATGVTDTVFIDSAPAPWLSYTYQVTPPDSQASAAVYVAPVTVAADTTVSAVTEGAPAIPPLRLAATPNPASGMVKLQFSLPNRASCTIRIYDVSGRMVRNLARAPFPSGTTILEWDGRDSKGRPVASGIYFTRLDTERGIVVHKLVMAR